MKRVLDFPGIEEYVEGKRAERDLARAHASNEAARQKGRAPFFSPRELEDMQRKLERYKQLRNVVDERHAQLGEVQQQGKRPAGAGGKKKEEGKDGIPLAPKSRLEFSTQQTSSLLDQVKAGFQHLRYQWQNGQRGANSLLPHQQSFPTSSSPFRGRHRMRFLRRF